MSGVYSEKLSTGGELKVTSYEWYISYYFSGIDRRYNGKIYKINGKDIDKYIQAWQNNFNKYIETKKLMHGNGEITINGDMGMVIVCGGILDGLYLTSYNMKVTDKYTLQNIIKDYSYAKEKSYKIQEIFKNIL